MKTLPLEDGQLIEHTITTTKAEEIDEGRNMDQGPDKAISAKATCDGGAGADT